MIPIFLWSVVVTQSIQRLVCRGAATLCGDHLRDGPRGLGEGDRLGGSTGSVTVDMG